MHYPSIYLIKGREKSVLRRHPWIFSRGIERVEGKPTLGQTVDVFDHKGQWLARGAYSPQSQIRVRIWCFDQQPIDIDFFKNRLQQAQKLRDPIIARDKLTGYRLIAAESDGLPGITIDRYADFLVCQLLSAGAEMQKPALIAALTANYPTCHIYERSDASVRKKEGLPLQTGVLHGEIPPDLVEISENNVKILVDIKHGHKTGFYLDQRDSREQATKYFADKRVLNCFCYSGGFGLYAQKGNAAQIINVDVSESALNIAQQNSLLNHAKPSQTKFINADVFKLLREYRDQGEQFDVIVMDPPKFAESKSQLQGACRGYKDINMLAMQLLKQGGILLTYSCSGLMENNLFQKILADAALDAKREIKFIERFSQAADHPVDSAYPEGLYLKGFACYIS